VSVPNGATDRCAADDCPEQAHDRCGVPGWSGCGWWFCVGHLFEARTGLFSARRVEFCGPCWDVEYGPDPDEPRPWSPWRRG
jgi:hypothetical protein